MNTHRLNRLREAMTARDVDAVLITTAPSGAAFLDGARLFNGTRAEPPGRVGVLVTAAALHVLGNHTEATRVADEELRRHDGVTRHGWPWHDWDLVRATDELSGDLGLGTVWTESFGEHGQPCRELLADLRYPLTAEEQGRLGRLGRQIALALCAAARGLEPGISEQQVAAGMHRRLLEAGALPDLIFVAFDERIEKYRHCAPGAVTLEQTALLSITASHRGLYASATRLVALGAASPELASEVAAANAIEAAAIGAVLDGGQGGEVFEAVREAYADQGHPDGWQQHHLGGRGGFAGRDGKIGPGCDVAFAPGGAFVFNPVVGAGKSEDTFLWREDGALICLTRDELWPTREVEVGGRCLARPGVLECPLPTQVGVIGLGRMGAGAARRLHDLGVEVIGLDPAGAQGAPWPVVSTPAELRQRLEDPARILLFVPQSAVDEILLGEGGLAASCQEGDVVVDAGNSLFSDSQRRAEELARQGIGYVDAGVSGGVEGAEHGYCVACGGQPEHYAAAAPLLEAMAAPGACALVGAPGAGHFVKMVHNGVEYGMLQAVAEGMGIVAHNAPGFAATPADFARVWRQGSVIQSRILDWFGQAAQQDAGDVAPRVLGGQTGSWTLDAARAAGVAAPVLEAALGVRDETPEGGETAAVLLALVRNIFGGHELPRQDNSWRPDHRSSRRLDRS